MVGDGWAERLMSEIEDGVDLCGGNHLPGNESR